LEKPFFFKNTDYRLFGILHTPDNEKPPLAGIKLGMVFCTPFAEEKMIAHRVFVNMARTLSEQGIACMRFDFMGEGDSEGNFEDSTIKTRLSDIAAAMSVLAKETGVEKIGLIGARFGGTLAALAACQNKLDSLILISPVVSGKSYMDQCLLSNLSTQMVAYKKIIKDRTKLIADLMEGNPVNIDGYLFGKDLYEEMVGVDLMDGPEITTRKILIIQVTKNEKQPLDHSLGKYYEKLKNNSPETEIMKVQEEPFWKDSKIYSPLKRELHKVLVNWISERLDREERFALNG
jgi:exosortase A-associated hydrolase 2